MPQKDDFHAGRASSVVLGKEILTRGELPRAEDGGVPPLPSAPIAHFKSSDEALHGYVDRYFVITDCKRYLKRLVDDD